jgi:hypothetical protein
VDLVVHPVDQVDRQEMMPAISRIALGQLDLVVPAHVVDGADMTAVGADHFHVFLDLGGCEHRLVSLFR